MRSGAALRRRQDSAHYVCDLECSAMTLRISAARHRDFVGRCACGHETTARPGIGRSSEIKGRRRNPQLTERCRVGPMLVSIDRGIREFGVACEPTVEVPGRGDPPRRSRASR